MGFNLEFIDIIILLIYLLILFVLWKFILKKNTNNNENYVNLANNYFVSFILIAPLILYLSLLEFKDISMKTISQFAFPIFLLSYLFFLIFHYIKQKKKRNNI